MLLEPTISLKRDITGHGYETAKVLIVTDHPDYGDLNERELLSTFAGRLLTKRIKPSLIRVEAVCEEIPPGNNYYRLSRDVRSVWEIDFIKRIEAFKPNIIVPLGNVPLEILTNGTCKSIDKWHLSILTAFNGIKMLPLLHPRDVLKTMKRIAFLQLGIERVIEECEFPELVKTERKFDINPTKKEITVYAVKVLRDRLPVSVDIETCNGQITCIGFSNDPKHAMCIPTLPSDWPDKKDFFTIWEHVNLILASDLPKIMQNGIYDMTYLSKYGIRTMNFWHDTMIAQKFLFPELPMGLDTIARMHTNEPYWKDEGKDWGERQDKNQLYIYNCKDAAVTLEAAYSQNKDLVKRKLDDTFYNYLMKLTAPVSEMCWRGLPLDLQNRESLRTEVETNLKNLESKLNKQSLHLLGNQTNPRSPAQVKKLLVAAKIPIPKKFGKETTDKKALTQLKLKKAYQDSEILDLLLKLSHEQKQFSSYLNYAYDPDERLRYTLSLHGTESGRMSCYKDPWDRGLNAQTIPKKLKSQFKARPGYLLVETDLRQAESRFVAWNAPEPTLIEMYNDGVDIHRYVASLPELFNCPIDKVTDEQRQLGKRCGHASNYKVGPNTLAEACLVEMNLKISASKARQMLEGYYGKFSGIPRWHRRIQDTLTTQRKLKTPFGRERYFYGRLDDSMFREAYAYEPQSVVTDCINHLVLHLFRHERLLLQVHDSCLIEVKEERLQECLTRIKDQDQWNPKLNLLGGEFRIPIEIKVGRRWSEMEEVFVG